jgi:colanic acid biosynthesis glycosyl transferase WcaI
LIAPADRATNALLKETGLTGKWVVQYAGNMGRTHGLEFAVEAARQLAKADPEIHFMFLGFGARLRMLQDAAQNTANVTVLPPRPRNDQPNFLNACDVSLVCFGEGMSGVSVPSRMYNILAAGKPIIAVADEDSELAQLVREERVGWVVPPGRPDALVAAVLQARRTITTSADIAARARRAAEKYSLAAAVVAYEEIVGSLEYPHRHNTAQPTALRSS